MSTNRQRKWMDTGTDIDVENDIVNKLKDKNVNFNHANVEDSGNSDVEVYVDGKALAKARQEDEADDRDDKDDDDKKRKSRKKRMY
ncbi:hypothetical protein [Shouchella shacheensis]|uniref:hypothetical protein n=1 Tax=Shouchella shacheensis TaxID=1649580 RepID=UPI000740258F|nr:hypothetical protein [Shouchella shacheensis]